MFDTFGGLPLHPLVIHAVVVLGPLAALALAAYSLVPRWQRALRWPTLALATVGAASAWVATRSGEWLRGATYPERVPAPVATHADAGELAAYGLYALLGATFVVILLLLRPDRTATRGARLLGVLLALAAAGFALWVVLAAGHSGATAVWGGSATPAVTPGYLLFRL